MAKKAKPRKTNWRRCAKEAFAETNFWINTAGDYSTKLADARATREVQAEELVRLRADNAYLTGGLAELEDERARTLVMVTKLNESIASLRNDIAATVRDAELTRNQLNTVLAHREALLDAMATTRFVAEQKAREAQS